MTRLTLDQRPLGSDAKQRMNTAMRHNLRFALGVGMLAFVSSVLAQPDPDRRTFYQTRIRQNSDTNELLRAITELRRQLPDTTELLDTRQRLPSRIAHQQEALFLNFLCYIHETRITGQSTCGLQHGFRNYDRMMALGPVDGYPSAAEQQQAYAEACSLQRQLCASAFEQNGNRLNGLPPNACGCAPVLEVLLRQTEEHRRADGATAEREEEARATLRVAARIDSIQRVERAHNGRLTAAIYAPKGILRCDTTFRIRTTSIDGLNNALLNAMFSAARAVFVNGREAERDWELMASTITEGRPMILIAKTRKQKDRFQLEDMSIGDFSSNMHARLLSELYLREVAPFVADGELLVLPYRVVLDPTLTGTNIRLDAADGYVNILLRPIPEVRKD